MKRHDVTWVLLVRHGQSTWNASGRWQGQADPPLSALGERQADLAGAALEAAYDVDALWSSDLVRAHATAVHMGTRLALPVRDDARLRERHVGGWQGLTRAEIETGWPGYLRDGRRPSGFEPDETLMVRAAESVAAIALAVPGGTVVAVTHGGLVRAVERWLGARPVAVPNLAGRWIEARDGCLVLGDPVALAEESGVGAGTPPDSAAL